MLLVHELFMIDLLVLAAVTPVLVGLSCGPRDLIPTLGVMLVAELTCILGHHVVLKLVDVRTEL